MARHRRDLAVGDVPRESEGRETEGDHPADYGRTNRTTSHHARKDDGTTSLTSYIGEDFKFISSQYLLPLDALNIYQ